MQRNTQLFMFFELEPLCVSHEGGRRATPAVFKFEEARETTPSTKNRMPESLSVHRRERRAEQPPAAPRPFDSLMDLSGDSLSDFAFAFEFDEDDQDFCIGGASAPAFHEIKVAKGVRSVTELPEHPMIPSTFVPSTFTSMSFQDFTARDQLEQLANKTVTSRHTGGVIQFDCMPLVQSSCPA